MASIKGNTQSKYAFSLLCHGQLQGTNSLTNSFELNESEIADARELVTKLRSIRGNQNNTPTKKELLAAITLLVNEKDI